MANPNHPSNRAHRRSGAPRPLRLHPLSRSSLAGCFMGLSSGRRPIFTSALSCSHRRDTPDDAAGIALYPTVPHLSLHYIPMASRLVIKHTEALVTYSRWRACASRVRSRTFWSRGEQRRIPRPRAWVESRSGAGVKERRGGQRLGRRGPSPRVSPSPSPTFGLQDRKSLS